MRRFTTALSKAWLTAAAVRHTLAFGSEFASLEVCIMKYVRIELPIGYFMVRQEYGVPQVRAAIPLT